MAALRAMSSALVVVAALLVCACTRASASQDPSLCPYELGYNPTFNADGSVLFCSKGSEIFQVDPAGILPTSLRGIGQSILFGGTGFLTGNFTPFLEITEPDAIFALPDGPTPLGPEVAAFITETFVFPPGADPTAVFQVSQFHFLSFQPPLTASVHIFVLGSAFTTSFDAIWRLNTVSGQQIWQIHQTLNLSVVPV